MAINIPIVSSFNDRGTKQANASFAKLKNSVGSLSQNLAVAGVAIGAVGAGLGKTVMTASNYAESVNAVNVAFGKSAKGIIDFGKTAATTLGVSQVDFNNAAVRFSAFAERIVGSGGDASKFIGEISTRASDFASVFNIDVAQALQVFQSGLAGEAEPLKRFGINLLDSEVKAYAAANGIGAIGKELTETEKVQARYGLLMQATSKTSGDFANTSGGLANQLRILNAEVSNTQIEIGNQLLPVMEDLLPIVRDLVRDLGTQLVAAVKAVDFRTLATDISNTAKFFIENATAIGQVTVALFALNTSYKLLQVAIGLTTVALQLNKWWLGQVTAGTTVATTATTIFSAALRLIPIVAIVAGIALLVSAFTNTSEWAGKSASGVANFAGKLDYAGGKAAVLRTQLDKIPKEIKTTYTLIRQNARQVASSFGGSAFDALSNQSEIDGLLPDPKTTGSSSTPSLGATLKREAAVVKKQAELIGSNVSEGLAARLTSGSKPVAAANRALKAITNNNGKLTKNLRNMEKNLKVVADAAAASVAAAEEPIKDTSVEDAIAAKERAYTSFADSVKNTFGSIKDSILGAFDITQLGASTNSITRNIDKLLNKLRGFTANVRQLAGMGLDPALLQQVISAGPVAGANLAASLVAGGTDALSRINQGFSEFGSLSGEIAQTGTQSLFGRSAQQNVYNINVSGGVGSGSTIGQAIVDAIKAYERTSGAVWVGA